MNCHLEMNSLYAMSRQIVYKQYAAVFVAAAVAHRLEAQRGLYRGVAHRAGSTRKPVAIEEEASDEEEGLVETCDGEARKGLNHVGMEVPAILLLESGGARRERVVVEVARYIHLILVEVVEVIFRVHHPLSVSKHLYLQRGIVHLHVVELGNGEVQLRRPASV